MAERLQHTNSDMRCIHVRISSLKLTALLGASPSEVCLLLQMPGRMLRVFSQLLFTCIECDGWISADLIHIFHNETGNYSGTSSGCCRHF